MADVQCHALRHMQWTWIQYGKPVSYRTLRGFGIREAADAQALSREGLVAAMRWAWDSAKDKGNLIHFRSSLSAYEMAQRP